MFAWFHHTFLLTHEFLLELDIIDLKTAQSNADLILLYPVQKRLTVP